MLGFDVDDDFTLTWISMNRSDRPNADMSAWVRAGFYFLRIYIDYSDFCLDYRFFNYSFDSYFYLNYRTAVA